MGSAPVHVPVVADSVTPTRGCPEMTGLSTFLGFVEEPSEAIAGNTTKIAISATPVAMRRMRWAASAMAALMRASSTP